MTDNMWSPFDPQWYQLAFEKYDSVANELSLQEEVIKNGYTFPDIDGTKSSVFRNEAVLNNTFNEKVLHETLDDIYQNSFYKLKASNHDRTGFYRWVGSMKDAKPVHNTPYADILLPTETFISSSNRESYKLSQYYRKWIPITELLNHWDIFKFAVLMFVNRKIYSEYQIRIDEQQTTIRFRYYDHWKKSDTPIEICKFETLYQCRIKVTKHMLEQFDWGLPVSTLDDTRIKDLDKCIGYFNRINGSEISRSDGKTNTNTMGENLEFLRIENGIIDLSNISNLNREVLISEHKEWVWLTLIHPRYFHEFPILLPSDVVYRPYQPDYVPVFVNQFGENKHVYDGDDLKTIYVNLNHSLDEWNDGWKTTIRPMVLSDAFRIQDGDMYLQIQKEIQNILLISARVSDDLENLRRVLSNYSESEFVEICSDLSRDMDELHRTYYDFLDSRRIEINEAYEVLYERFKEEMILISEKETSYDGFHRESNRELDFWDRVSPLVHIPERLSQDFRVADIIQSIGPGLLWENDNSGKFYYSHPIDVTDIWIFEYDQEENVWYPTNIEVQHHFPDVYTFHTDGDLQNRIFKAFIFYSQLNYHDPVPNHRNATALWDTDLEEYQIHQNSRFRDIFSEKFYWMAIHSVYRGKIQTEYRWELIEYIQDNISYERFNELFLNSFAPYFKYGLANYSQSEQYGFSLDYAIDKFNESINNDPAFKRVTNYELYLDRSVIKSYFDHVTNINDSWDWSNRLIKRPRPSFDVLRLVPTLRRTQEIVASISRETTEVMTQSLNQITERGYNIKPNYIRELLTSLQTLNLNAQELYQFTNSLDQDIYSKDDIGTIRKKIQQHLVYCESIVSQFNSLLNHVISNSRYAQKKAILDILSEFVESKISSLLESFGRMENSFDIDEFMRLVDNPEYLENPSDDTNSLIGYINRFGTSWHDDVKQYRNDLHLDCIRLWGMFERDKAYSIQEIDSFSRLCDSIDEDLVNLRAAIFSQWRNEEKDEYLVNRLEFAEEQITLLREYIRGFVSELNLLSEYIDSIRIKLVELGDMNLSPEENRFMNIIDTSCEALYSHFGYICGRNSYRGAFNAIDVIRRTIGDWNVYVAAEKVLFQTLERNCSTEDGFLARINPYNELLRKMIPYLESVEQEFIPDSDTPSYSKVYSVQSAEQITGGLLNKTGDKIFITGIGVYRITSSEDGVSTGVEKIDVRTTSFRDPSWCSNPVDGITSGEGMGITFKPAVVVSENIKDDFPVKKFIDKVTHIVYLIGRDMGELNSYNNKFIQETIDRIRSVSNDWERTYEIIRDYINPETGVLCSQMIQSCLNAIPNLVTLMESRNSYDIRAFLDTVDHFIIDCKPVYDSYHLPDARFSYFEGRMRVVWTKGVEYFNDPNGWTDVDGLKRILGDIRYELRLFWRKMIRDLSIHEMEDRCNGLIETEESIIDGIDHILEVQDLISRDLNSIQTAQGRLPDSLSSDPWYQINSIGVALGGEGYNPGDVVRVVPELSKDAAGNVIHGNDEVVLNDDLYAQVISVDENGSVTKVVPLIQYAIPYQLYGKRETEAEFGNGRGLLLSFYESKITGANSTILLDQDSTRPRPNQFDENDLFAFRFQNIYDLPIAYELFLGGLQKKDYILRHVKNSEDSMIDVIYLNANEVMNLNFNDIYEKAEHYFIYKLDELTLLDGGAGYRLGQKVTIGTDQAQIQVTVSELDGTPLHGIKKVEPASGSVSFEGVDPTSEIAEAIPDVQNNIDDEYHVSYYDSLPAEGEEVRLANDLPENLVFTRTHHDGSGNRNEYESTNDSQDVGDPDDQWILGHRVDWNKPAIGMQNTLPVSEPFITDDERVPDLNNLRSDYQEIENARINDQSVNVLTSLDEKDVKVALNLYDPVERKGEFRIRDIAIAPLDDERIPPVLEDEILPEGTPTVTLYDGSQVKAIDLDVIRDIVLNDLEPIPNPPPFYTEDLQTRVENNPNKIHSAVLNQAMMVEPDLTVPTHSSLPTHISEWPDVQAGKTVVVQSDETYNGHRMLYVVGTFLVTGYIIYDSPEIADWKWTFFDIDWLKTDAYPDLPDLHTQYPSKKRMDRKTVDEKYDEWWSEPSYKLVTRDISNGDIARIVTPVAHQGTYIHNLTVDDLAVWNYTKKEWEDLHSDKWHLETRESAEEGYGFRLYYLGEFPYSNSMRLYLKKVPDVLQRNAALKANALFKIHAHIDGEVDHLARYTSINVGKHLRFRKLFPYEQKESYKIKRNHYGLDFKIAPYIHFRNQMYAQDLIVYNKTEGKYENPLDPTLFELQMKDPKAWNRGQDINTRVLSVSLPEGQEGSGFYNGRVWGWSPTYGIHIFGYVTADFLHDGHITSFSVTHCPNPPSDSRDVEFRLYQRESQYSYATAVVKFHVTDPEHDTMEPGDGWIHKVTNPLALLSDEFRLVYQRDLQLGEEVEYEVRISKSPKIWKFMSPVTKIFPTFTEEDGLTEPLNENNLYVLTEDGRLPLINPSTEKPSFYIENTEHGCRFTLLNVCKAYEVIELHQLPYPIRSVYTQRRLPKNGFLDLKGKLNKPLSKKYYEFWVNGRLLDDEVSIISPTKVFFHGLKSLRNLEIIEVNRNPDEFFSDFFLEGRNNENGRISPRWNFETYIDAALEGNLKENNYTPAEIAMLLAPVWYQVPKGDQSYPDYPENLDIEPDILTRVDDYEIVSQMEGIDAYQFIVADVPSIESIPLNTKSLDFVQLGLMEMTSEDIIELLNEEWEEEIRAEIIQKHSVISEDEWYGVAVKMYDEMGEEVTSISQAAYIVADNSLIRINSEEKSIRVVRNDIEYDVS